jgi:enoyl-CoA hydratase/carnithine racemase
MTTFLKQARQDGVVILTMDRPAERNVLSEQWQFDEFVEVCAAINADQSIAAVILTGEGKAFCAGGNIKGMQERSGMFEGTPYELRTNYLQGIQRIPLALYNLQVPTIAAVNGPAIGAGCDLACMCDIRVAAESATFAESFVKLGIVPGDGGAWLLQRVVGASKACEMSFTGDNIGAVEALACGLVSRVVPDDRLMDEVVALATRIAANSPPALRMSKRLIREAQFTRLETILDMSASMQALAHFTEQHRLAVDAATARLGQKKS